MAERRNVILKNNMDCPESRRSPVAVFMPMLDSAEKYRTPGLNYQDDFAFTGYD